MLKSYQLILSIGLLFACFNLGTSFARNMNSNFRSPNATHFKPAHTSQPWVAPGYNHTRPSNGRFNETRVHRAMQSSPQYGAHYQGAVQPPNIGFNNNVIASGTYQSNGTHGFHSQAQSFGVGFPNRTPQGNYNYSAGALLNGTYPYASLFNQTKSAPSNSTYPYGKLFKFW